MKRVWGLALIVSFALFCFGKSKATAANSTWNCFLENKYYTEIGYDIAVHPCGNTLCVMGLTRAWDFPTTAGAFDITHNSYFEEDIFVTRFSSTGSKLLYSTFLGGWGIDVGHRIAMDNSGNVYVTGETSSGNFPVTDSAFDVSYNTNGDAFVTKLNTRGTALRYSTFLGGDKSDCGYSIDIDMSGNAYVTGLTGSADFPISKGAFDTTFNGGTSSYSGGDIFIAKINPSGTTLKYSTFVGGNQDEWGRGIAVDNSGRVYVAGHTQSPDFPVTTGAFDSTYHGGHDVIVFRLNVSGEALEYSTYLGGAGADIGEDIVVDRFDCAHVTGSSASDDFPIGRDVFDSTHNGNKDVFVLKLEPTGEDIKFSTFLGGDNHDEGKSIALDARGCVYVTGHTRSSNFPTTDTAFDTSYNGGYNAFVCKLTPSGKILSYSTFLGKNSRAFGIALDQHNCAYVTGGTESPNFPTTSGAFDNTLGGWDDIFVTKLDATASSLIFSTFLGGDWIDTGVSEHHLSWLPPALTLHQNYPNPFNSSTEIRYRIPADGHVTLKIYNTLGQQVRILMDTEQSVGEHIIHWDGRDDGGQEVASGLYFCRFQVGDFTETIKMMLVK